MLIGKQAKKQRLQTTEVEKIHLPYVRHSEGGFTIIESLVAILVVAILLVAIAPVLSLSVATRVQSRRIELATQAAKSYIDGVKTKKIVAPSGPTTATTLTATSAPTATGTLTCNTASTPTSATPVESKFCSVPTPPTGTSLYCIDFDGSGTCESTSVTDMVVQGFRPNNNPDSAGYALGVRVYRADAFKDSVALLTSNSLPNNKQATFTGGVGQRKAPLVEITTDINDTVPKYSDLCARYTGGCN
ncbi:hormogonium polysaccharide secretion pseudopilin HpsB [Nostoc sp. CHAB 5836]|uniref:hormogonium polysaccharide secretion pseudopilin HpsB n=1 Tax=Nostoc sp. CHAB 5836 TaxID=2780404 RepID=UPI001E542943|nr:hormogonium polysaccharide secretion pseudopilin HpsB [Nostoc sp. CHAB 5836]MCC5616781.1 hormogonium polysaccharide secretion pseudopilin HpsB [Nostoc sp. CHAB 5836]